MHEWCVAVSVASCSRALVMFHPTKKGEIVILYTVFWMQTLPSRCVFGSRLPKQPQVLPRIQKNVPKVPLDLSLGTYQYGWSPY